MISEPASTPLTSLNAIKLSAREVAGTFVPPPAFDTLLRADNAILTGPRGSGKTTLLKMMQAEALENWNTREAEAARNASRSVGVFVGADRTWNEQLSVAIEGVNPSIQRALSTSAFTTHVLRSLIEAIDYRLHGPVGVHTVAHQRISAGALDEKALSRRLASLARLPLSATSLPTLRRHMADRLIDLGMMRIRARRSLSIDLPDWIDLDFIGACDAMSEAFNLASAEPDRKWAMLFDELELAPQDVVSQLLAALRGSQPRLLFKLSLAPVNARFDAFGSEAAPVPGQDYELIPLTYARKLPALKFAKTLVQATLEQASSGVPVSPERLLGSGRLDSRDDLDADQQTPSAGYEVGSTLWNTMKALESRDLSFKNYLATNGLDLDHLDDLDSSKRAARLRKIRNLVVVREHFRGDDGRRRSRKNSALYRGTDSILSLPDGNPRMIIALVRQLFPVIDAGQLTKRVATVRQGAAIDSTLHRFQALIDAQQAEQIDGQSVGLIDLLDRIGASLARRAIEQPFNDNVALTLRIPTLLRPEIMALFIRGVNTGAFVHVPPRNGGSALSTDLYGKHFRLSHLIATRYGLPIHLTPSSSLDEHLPVQWRGTAHAPIESASHNVSVPTLFDEKEL